MNSHESTFCCVIDAVSSHFDWSFAEPRVESIEPIFRAVRALSLFFPRQKSEILRRELQSNAAEVIMCVVLGK